MHRLYQWLSRRASLLRSESLGKGRARTARTQITIEQQEMTMLINGASTDFDICPFCGQKLGPGREEEARLRLLGGSTAHAPFAERNPP